MKTNGLLTLVIGLCLTSLCNAKGLDAKLQAKAEKAVEKGYAFLKTRQAEDGSWLGKQYPAITGIVLKAFLMDDKYTARTPFIRKGLDYIVANVQPDGGIYRKVLGNYNTNLCIMALAEAKDPKLAPVLERAVAFAKGLQWDEGENTPRSNSWYGGAGYGNRQRPDLCNLSMLLDAMHDAGVSPDDPVFKRAVVFISRCQNNSETNQFASLRLPVGNDGGFFYTCANRGESKAAPAVVTAPDGKKILHSYGSMTYAGVKGLLYANLKREDRRIQGALRWIRENYTLDENPGMGQKALYFYYITFARTMDVLGDETFTDARGIKHAWRTELAKKLISLQSPDGRWQNEKSRWMEATPELVTPYAIVALKIAMKK